MHSHSENDFNSASNTSIYSTSNSTQKILAPDWLKSADSALATSHLPEFQQNIIHSFLTRLANKDSASIPSICPKFFDPLAGP